MTVAPEHRARSAPTRSAPRFRWSPRTRKLLLVTHVAATGGWLGADVALGALVVAALSSAGPAAAANALAVASIASWPLISLAAGSLGSGLLLGLGTRHGVLRYGWVIVKLVINSVMLVLVIVVLVPAAIELRTAAEHAIATGTPFIADARLLFPPIVSGSALVVAIALSVVKPGTGRRRGVPPARPA